MVCELMFWNFVGNLRSKSWTEILILWAISNYETRCNLDYYFLNAPIINILMCLFMDYSFFFFFLQNKNEWWLKSWSWHKWTWSSNYWTGRSSNSSFRVCLFLSFDLIVEYLAHNFLLIAFLLSFFW